MDFRLKKRDRWMVNMKMVELYDLLKLKKNVGDTPEDVKKRTERWKKFDNELRSAFPTLILPKNLKVYFCKFRQEALKRHNEAILGQKDRRTPADIFFLNRLSQEDRGGDDDVQVEEGETVYPVCSSSESSETSDKVNSLISNNPLEQLLNSNPGIFNPTASTPIETGFIDACNSLPSSSINGYHNHDINHFQNINDKSINKESEKNDIQAKKLDAVIRKIEAEAKKTEAETKKIELENRLLELEMEKKRLEIDTLRYELEVKKKNRA